MSQLPAGWREARLDEVAEVKLGRQRSPKDHHGPSMVPYLRAANVTRQGLNLTDVKEMNFSASEIPVFRLQFGDILLAEASGSADQVGKPAIWRDEIPGCCFQNTLLRVRAREAEPAYLYWYFRFLVATRAFAAASRGVGIHHLGATSLSAWRIPMPSGREQTRVVASIEEQFSRIDSGHAAIERANVRTPSLVRGILESRIPLPAPSGWETTTVGEAGEIKLGRQRAPRFHSGPGMRPYLRVANVYEDRIDASDLKRMAFTDAEFDRFRLVPGDILLNEGQSPELLGRPARYAGVPQSVAFTNTLLRFRSRSDVMSEWALLVFRRHFHTGRFTREAHITTNIAHLSAGRLAMIEFPIPPMSEQQHLVAEIEAELSTSVATVMAVKRIAAKESSLRAAVLTEAFAGRLAA